MIPEASLTNEQKARHNELYVRASELLNGLLILDDQPRMTPDFFERRKLRKAVKLFQQVLRLNPANWQAMFFAAKAAQSLGNFKKSLAWFLRAQTLVPDHPAVAKEVGYAASRLGKHDLAVNLMESVAKQHPRDAALHCNLGLSCLLAGNVSHACKTFEWIVELEPQSDLNKKLLAFAKEVEAGTRPCPETEEEISSAI